MARPPDGGASGLLLVLVTPGDREARLTQRLIESALAGGVTAVLLREPQLDAVERAELAAQARIATRAHDALLLVHRDVHLALDCVADGVHTGHGGLSVEDLRRQAPDLLVGRSCHWPVTEEDRRADYVLLSPFRPTPKSHPRPLLETEQVRACLDDPRLGPIVALGGLAADDVAALPEGVAGVAVMRALSDAGDARAAAAELRAALDARFHAATRDAVT
ncbi:MAG: thiamine phosphate synthase [Planctomycetota bacterium]|jgi:thiamine-phosphate pyrophosphorylase